MKIVRSMVTRLLALGTAAAMALGLTACGVDIESIGLPPNLVMEKGTSQQLEIQYDGGDEVSTAEIAEAASKLTLEWVSSDENVVTVDETGMATAVGAGEADVTVTAKEVDVSSTTHIKVVILPTGVEAPETMTLDLNGEATKALGAKMTPEDATDVKLAYASSDESVATVDESGNVTAVGVGECTITTTIVADTTATAEDAGVDSEMLVVPENAKAETKVTVGKAIESITLDSNEGVLTVGNTHTIKATVVPEDATNKAITWKSSDESIATVDAEGNVTAKGTGNVTITAVNSDGDVSSTYELTVKAVTCSYCGQTGHTSSNCPVKAADQKAAQQAAAQAAAQQQAAAQAAAQQQAAAAAQAAEQQAAQQAQQQAAEQAAQQQQAQQQQSSGGSSGGSSSGGSPVEGDWDAGFGLSSGIDWTQDSSHGSLSGEADVFD